MDILSDRIRRLRLDAGLNQADVAVQINTSRSSYNTYESGRTPPVDVVLSLADYYGVSTDYLLGVSSDRRPAGDAVTVTLEKLAPIVTKAGAEPLPASDVARLAARLLEYYRKGAPAGNAPMEIARAQLRAMDELLSATLTGSAAQVLDAVNRAAASILDLHKVLDYFLSDKTD